jgi:putative ABC transport system substrate-binding protein
MKRRWLCGALAMSAVQGAGSAGAQPAAAFRVAWVSLEKAGSSSPTLAAFRAGLAELGYVEGRNLVIQPWWADGSAVRLEQMRGEILAARPDVIVAQGGIALAPMLHASVDRPVVFSMSGDPVAARLVDSYAHPGGRASGITLFAAELAGKRMALLKEMLPGLRGIAVMANPAHPGAPRELQSSRDAAARLGLALSYFPTPSVAELDAALVRIAHARLDAILVFADGFALEQAERIAVFSVRERIPVAAGWASFAQRGNLLAYGPEFNDVYRRLAGYADRILKGARAGDLPIEQPTRFELVINLKTARAIGVQVPRSLVLQADEVIE